MSSLPSAHALKLLLLGGFDARLNDHPVTGISYNKMRALLAYLAFSYHLACYHVYLLSHCASLRCKVCCMQPHMPFLYAFCCQCPQRGKILRQSDSCHYFRKL